jgi:hypothetical protein
MEQLLLTSKNLARAKRQNKGQISVTQLLEKIEQFDHVHIEADWPKQELLLNWEECFTPLLKTTGFNELISSKLYAYKFQYLGSFSYGELSIACGGPDSDQACETFAAKMAERKIYSSEVTESDACNCTWLIDMLLNADRIAADPLREEQLIWQANGDAFEFVLEANLQDGKLLERQIIRFLNAYEQLSWEHHVLLK